MPGDDTPLVKYGTEKEPTVTDRRPAHIHYANYGLTLKDPIGGGQKFTKLFHDLDCSKVLNYFPKCYRINMYKSV